VGDACRRRTGEYARAIENKLPGNTEAGLTAMHNEDRNRMLNLTTVKIAL